MSCKTVCRLCPRLVVSRSVSYSSGVLTVDLPAGNYANGEKYCIVVAQAIPDAAIINAPVVISINGSGSYPLVTKCCATVVAGSIRTRTRYSTVVVTSATGGTFKLMGDIRNDTANIRPSIP